MAASSPAAVESVSGIDVQDAVLITVKAYDTGVVQYRAIVGRHTIVATVQNGLGNAEKLVRAYGPRAIVGVPVLGATYLGPGEIKVSGLKEVVVGSTVGQHGSAVRLAAALTECGVPSRISASIMNEVWSKAVVNASINPITALVGKENGSILRDDGLRELSRAVCLEAARTADACGILLASDPFERVMEIVRATAGNRSSMLQDVERGRRTEIDQINGALVRAGEAKGIDMPINRTLWSLVRGKR